MSGIIGIDPGLDGACCLLSDGKPLLLDAPTLEVRKGKKVKREYNLAEMHTIVLGLAGADAAFLEHVWAAPVAGRKQGGQSMFSMGEGLMAWKAMLTVAGIPFTLVTPQVWKMAMGLAGKDKDASRHRALQLYASAGPDLARKKDVGRADALLIAEYGRRVYQSATHAIRFDDGLRI